MSDPLDELRRPGDDSRKLHTFSSQHPEINGLHSEIAKKIQAEINRGLSEEISKAARENGWYNSYDSALEAYDRSGLFNEKRWNASNSIMSPKEIRDGAPSMGTVMDTLKSHPKWLEKVDQGFTEVLLVPFGLSLDALKAAMGRAIFLHKNNGTLRLRNGETSCGTRECAPVRMFHYENADQNGSLVYYPERFDPKEHGGGTKTEVLESSKFPGWQVFLIENSSFIPREGQGQIIGGRPQIEVNHTPDAYLTLLRSEGYKNEQGLTLEAWQSMFLAHLAKTDGEVLDHLYDAACTCIGQYYPSLGIIPQASWINSYEQAAHIYYGHPGYRNPLAGTRSGVRVL